MNDITVERLNKHQVKELKQISEIVRTFLKKDQYISPLTTFEIIKSYCNKDGFPAVIIAKSKQELIGFSFLILNDTQLKQDIYPIINMIYVKEKFRNMGIGSKLIMKTIEYAKEKFEKIFVITDIKGYFEKFGFKSLGKTSAYINFAKDNIVEKRIYIKNFNKKI